MYQVHAVEDFVQGLILVSTRIDASTDGEAYLFKSQPSTTTRQRDLLWDVFKYHHNVSVTDFDHFLSFRSSSSHVVFRDVTCSCNGCLGCVHIRHIMGWLCWVTFVTGWLGGKKWLTSNSTPSPNGCHLTFATDQKRSQRWLYLSFWRQKRAQK